MAKNNHTTSWGQTTFYRDCKHTNVLEIGSYSLSNGSLSDIFKNNPLDLIIIIHNQEETPFNQIVSNIHIILSVL